jgi:phosphoglycerate dehydrogenase-like enzyme
VPDQPRILVVTPRPLYRALFSAQTDAELRSLGRVAFNESDHNWTSAKLAGRIAEADACIIGWDSPRFDGTVLKAADTLQIISHTGGSIKEYCPPAVFQRGIIVTNAAAAIAPAVGELTLLLTMLCLRKLHKIDLHSPNWFDSCAPNYQPGDEIAGQRVGIVGASLTGLTAIQLFQAIGAEVWVYDPYLSAEQAGELDVAKKPLDELMGGCNIVSLHAPATSETQHMIGHRELALLRDGAVFVNTARACLVDSNSLLAELKTGRFVAALDVFDDEPLPTASLFRNLPNVVLTPHLGGTSAQARYRQGHAAVEELRRFFEGEALQHRVTLDMLPIMA